MSKKANTTLIGVFVVGAVVLVIVGLLIFGSGKFFTQKRTFVLFFDESVKGLSIGAPVDFRGVRVGSVSDVKIVIKEDLSPFIPVYIEIEPDSIQTAESRFDLLRRLERRGAQSLVALLVKEGLRAQLAMQSMVTGQLGIHLDFFPDTPMRLLHADKKVPEIPTKRSSLSELSKTLEKVPVEEIAQKVLLTIDGLEKLVNSPDLKTSVAGINQSVKEMQALLKNINNSVQPLANNAGQAIDDARTLMHEVNGSIKPLASELAQTTQDAGVLMRSLNTHVPDLVARVGTTLKAADAALQQMNKGVDGIAGQNSAVRLQLVRALSELASAARSLRLMAEYLERHPEALIRGKSGSSGTYRRKSPD